MLAFVQAQPWELHPEKYTSAAVVQGNSRPSDPPAPENLYYVIVTLSHLQHDVNEVMEQIRVCGTYTSLKGAKAAARSCLFDAGFAREWFHEYDVGEDGTDEGPNGQAVHAVAPDGTVFTVSVATAANTNKLRSDNDSDDGLIERDLYHVLQTTVDHCSGSEDGGKRQTDVEGSFATFDEARRFAASVLLCPEDGITKDSFAEYSEAGPGEADCGYSEDVVVHAVGQQNGVNYLVRVVKTEELEAVRQAHAAARIR